MPRAHITKFCLQAWNMVHSEIDAQDINALFTSGVHTMRLAARRTSIIQSRVRLIAGLLAIIMLASAVVNVGYHPSANWLALSIPPLSAALCFVVIAVGLRGRHALQHAHIALLFLFAAAAVLCIFTQIQISSVHAGRGINSGYAYLPLVMLAGIAMLPLTVIEGGSLAVAMFVPYCLTVAAEVGRVGWDAGFSSLLIFGAISVIVVLAGLSQLSLLILLVREGIHDSLTGCYSRGCGEELLDLQYTWASRSHGRLAVAQVSLDEFHEVNVRFGYDIGDAMLKKATEVLHDSMRSGDVLIRWTGSQFLLVLPHASIDQAAGALERILSTGLGLQPNGVPITASIGVAERTHDSTEDWWKMVDFADSRVVEARQRGGNCTVTG